MGLALFSSYISFKMQLTLFVANPHDPMEAFRVHRSIFYGDELRASHIIGGFVTTSLYCTLLRIIEQEPGFIHH